MNTAATRYADTATTRGAGKARGGSAVRSLVRIRELDPVDGDVVDVVFAGCPRTAATCAPRPGRRALGCTRRNLRALDGRTHVALAAFAQGCPIGTALIIDLGEGRGALAVEVVDQWQGCGVGTQLLQVARDWAAELGYHELVGEVLAVNASVHATLRRVFPVTRVRRDHSELTTTMPLDGELASASQVEALVA